MKTQTVSKQPYGIIVASWADGSFVSTTDTFLLEINDGGGWDTVPSTEYALHAPIGEVIKRDYDLSAGTEVVWADGATYRATYTLINSTTLAESTYTQETQTADYLDEFAPINAEGEITASAPQDLRVQNIYAGFGFIGRWTINRQYLARDTGTNATSAGMAPIDYPFYAGATYANRASANFRVTPAGDVTMAGALTVGGSVTISGSVTVSGSMQSNDYVANQKGWKIAANGKAEFRDIEARGEFHAAVFVKNLIKATAGSEIIAKSGGSVKTAFTTVNSPTTFNVDVKDPPTGHAQLFSVGDILRVKDEAGSDAWLTVSSVSDQTTFYRYVCTKSNGTNATFYPGTVIIDYGASGQGFLFLSADDGDAPFYSVRTHAGAPWTTTTERGRFGNMRNAFGTGANNYYGFGVGDYSGGNYLKYETNGGFTIKAGGDVLTIDGSGLAFSAGISSAHFVRWLSGTDQTSVVFGSYSSDTSALNLGSYVVDTNDIAFSNLYAANDTRNVNFIVQANGTAAASNADKLYAKLYVNSGTLEGFYIGDNSSQPSSLLHLASTAPSFRMEDTTGGAESFLLTVNANSAIFKPVTGGNILELDLANEDVLVGSGTIAGFAPTGETFNARGNYSTNADHLGHAFVVNFTGTTGTSLQALEGYATASNASGNVGTVYGMIAHTEQVGAGTATDHKVFSGSSVHDNSCGAVTNVYIFKSDGIARVGTPGTITNAYGLYLDALPASGVTNRWGVYVAGASDKNYFAGTVGIGTTSVTSGYGLEVADSVLIDSPDSNGGILVQSTAASSTSVAATLTLRTNDNAAMASNDRIGQIYFGGRDDSTVVDSAYIIARASEAWTTTARGSQIDFLTTPNTTTAAAVAFQILNSGKVWTIGEIEINGDLNHDGTNVGFYGVAPVARPGAITQTYSTTATTLTQTTMTDPAAYGAGANGYSTAAMAQAIHAEVIALAANMQVTQNVLNYVIDSLQSQGLLQ